MALTIAIIFVACICVLECKNRSDFLKNMFSHFASKVQLSVTQVLWITKTTDAFNKI